jgi:hypothetical protein
VLLAAVRAAWPPADMIAGPRDDYRPTDLAALDVVGAVRLTDRFAVGLAADGDAFVVVPLVRDETDGWRRASPGDGVSAFVAGVPMASERPIGVDCRAGGTPRWRPYGPDTAPDARRVAISA